MNKISIVARVWKNIENAFFLFFAVSIIWITVGSFLDGTWNSFKGAGFFRDISNPVNQKEYYKAVLVILSFLTTFFLLFEMVKLIIQNNPFNNFKSKIEKVRTELSGKPLINKIRILFFFTRANTPG